MNLSVLENNTDIILARYDVKKGEFVLTRKMGKTIFSETKVERIFVKEIKSIKLMSENFFYNEFLVDFNEKDKVLFMSNSNIYKKILFAKENLNKEDFSSVEDRNVVKGFLVIFLLVSITMCSLSEGDHADKKYGRKIFSEYDVAFDCENAIRNLANYDVKVGFRTKTFSDISYKKEGGEDSYKYVLKYQSKFQNGFGAYQTYYCHCGVDMFSGDIIELECLPKRF